mmetsp:Transcript_30412/g.90751  ORF Transcript_30412/g.90751 Transcript_30412/m.90751 type:complete len:295 (+) Transcript_30412:884-1768(+)
MPKAQHFGRERRDHVAIPHDAAEHGPVEGAQYVHPFDHVILHRLLDRARTAGGQRHHGVGGGFPIEMQEEVTRRHGRDAGPQAVSHDVQFPGRLSRSHQQRQYLLLYGGQRREEIAVEAGVDAGTIFAVVAAQSLQAGAVSGVTLFGIFVGFPRRGRRGEVGQPILDGGGASVGQHYGGIVVSDVSLSIEHLSVLRHAAHVDDLVAFQARVSPQYVTERPVRLLLRSARDHLEGLDVPRVGPTDLLQRILLVVGDGQTRVLHARHDVLYPDCAGLVGVIAVVFASLGTDSDEGD